ncbi:hypothetical protein EUTSA_v10016225mg [Eutrema salsugineum]|uniref:DUF7653 domain-containing protein n=1 Tax=Eutrema salsugineum TaxID=72664 RepID=V4M8H1_EUTSA|nr:putative leucine-rich repeat-containing protein DDB_G0290503 isoform X2 [Eutrema salsugineum]ESQ52609.1 hypothetical protein EUTSA_v10016225mg [Eutrema salsugineum]
MKKLFFFKSSSSGNGTDKQIRREKESETCPKGLSMKPQSEEYGGHEALRRSRSFSSAAFLLDGATSSNDPTNATRSNHHRLRNHSSRCFTPERQCKKAEHSHMYKVHDSSGSLSTCSSNVSSQVLDRYIDGEEHTERSKHSPHSNLSGSVKGRRLPPRVQSPSPLSSDTTTVKDKRQPNGTRLNFSSTDYAENGLRDVSPRSLARSVIKRLSHAHKNLKPLSYESIRVQDVLGGNKLDSSLDGFVNLPLAEHKESVDEYDNAEHQELLNMHVGTKESDVSSELEKKYREAEKRVKLLSEELEEQKFLSDCDFDISSLVGDIRQMQEERVGLAFEVLSLLRSQMDERASAREEIKRAKADMELHIQRLEKEKSELQFGLEKELDRRSTEWTSKLESFQMEEKRLRERVRDLAEHNVSLQREVSTFHEKETERIDMIRRMDETVTELSATSEELREENVYLMQNLSKVQDSYTGTTEDLDCLKRNFEEKDMECRELHKSVTRFLRTCREQERTIQGLRDGFSEEVKKQPSEKREQIEQIRLAGVELSLRKEVESMKLEVESLRRDNICLLNRVKGNGEEVEITTIKLDNELKMRVCLLQDQGLIMLNESTQLCYKFLKFIEEKLAHFPESYQSLSNGLSEQFLIESEMRVHGMRRGTESLKRSLQTVTSLLLEKSNEMTSNSESSSSAAARPSEPNNQSVEKFLRAELRAESLVTSLLREKLYSKEEEIEQLQAEVAAGVRGNEVLQCEIQNVLDNLSVNTHQLKDLKLQMMKKDENINRLETNLEEAGKDLANMKANLPKVLEEREEMWMDVKECRKRNMELESEKQMLKNKVEKLEEDTLIKEGQITILKDTLGSKHFDLLSSPDFSYNDFLVQ